VVGWGAPSPPRAAIARIAGQTAPHPDRSCSATRVNAELLRLDGRIGTVEPGKEADLIAVAGNPLDDLRLFQDPERLHLVMKSGAVYRQRF
jgi:cytosine/adenosine deaminase-related metal-dependent hydrolase